MATIVVEVEGTVTSMEVDGVKHVPAVEGPAAAVVEEDGEGGGDETATPAPSVEGDGEAVAAPSTGSGDASEEVAVASDDSAEP
ncbi:hypothetical protein HY065_00765 [Candidatus Berkelbacteria bacterium]|nr:hypothetical protein [Candidatus Berkelbacteria bacterium]